MGKKTKKVTKQENEEKKTAPEEPLDATTNTSTDNTQTKEVKEEEETIVAPSENPMNSIFSLENKMRFRKVSEEEKEEPKDNEPAAVEKKESKHPVVEKPNEDSRTIFIGNLPVEVIQKPNQLRKLFSEYGKIKSMRFRSVAVKSSRIEHFDKKLMKKVSVIKGNLNEDAKVTNAYIVYENEESVEKALVLNNTIFLGRHITVDTVSKKSHNSKQESHRTLFIGNLPFNADEEELRSFFESQIKKRKGKNDDSSDDEFVVESVKIVRSKDTRTGKGFGYVTLKSAVHIPLALLVNGKTFGDREIRVTKYLRSAEAIEKKKQMDSIRNGRMKTRKNNQKQVKKVEKKEKSEKKEKKEKTEKMEKPKVEKVETPDKVKKEEKPKKVEKVEKKKERKPRTEKKEKKEKKNIDLSFMGKRASLSMNAVNAKKRILKKQK